MPLGASSSNATPANIPPSGAVQRTDPTKSVVLEPGNISSMNSGCYGRQQSSSDHGFVSITAPPCISMQVTVMSSALRLRIAAPVSDSTPPFGEPGRWRR